MSVALDTATTVAELERRLNDLLESVDASAVEDLDDEDRFPTELYDALNELGVQRCYVPTRFGGLLDDYPAAGRIVRTVARADVTLAVAHGKTFLGAVSVWVAGSDDQRRRLAHIIGEGHQVSWGLTERDRGSDLLSGDVRAEPVDSPDGGFLLHGEKWLINNATRGHAVCVLARTRPDATARGYSLFLVEKNDLDSGAFDTLPKELTHGIRGADISGIAFDGAYVPSTAMLGKDGHGLEIVLKALQLTRTMCCYLSLGAGDHALSITARFVRDRVLYGRSLGDLPAARTVLVESFGAQLLAEAMTTVAARSMHALPGELSALAAASKYFVPSIIEKSMVDLRRLMGARSLLSGQNADGTMCKIERDHRIVSLFDGNTIVNLNTLVSQFPVLLWQEHRRTEADDRGLESATTMTSPLPSLDLDRLTLLPRRGLGILAGLPSSVRELANHLDLTRPGERFAHDCAVALSEVVATLTASTRVADRDPVDVPTASFTAAEQLSACIAGAAAIRLYVNNRADVDGDPLWAGALWLQLALHTAVTRAGVRTVVPECSIDGGYAVLLDQLARHSHPTLFDTSHSDMEADA